MPNKIQIIKSVLGAELYRTEAATLEDAVVKAVASGANLRGANLYGANLRGADLRGANLYGADLRGADGLIPVRVTPLLMLLDQPGKIRAYKLVDAKLASPIHSNKVRYKIGESYAFKGNTDPNEQCGAGVNLATLDWCLKEWQQGWRVLIAEFEAKDIAAIPTATDGKFRVHRCTIVGEKDICEFFPKAETQTAATAQGIADA